VINTQTKVNVVLNLALRLLMILGKLRTQGLDFASFLVNIIEEKQVTKLVLVAREFIRYFLNPKPEPN